MFFNIIEVAEQLIIVVLIFKSMYLCLAYFHSEIEIQNNATKVTLGFVLTSPIIRRPLDQYSRYMSIASGDLKTNDSCNYSSYKFNALFLNNNSIFSTTMVPFDISILLMSSYHY